MAKPRIQSRVDPHVKRDLDDFAEEQDMTKAEAVRYLVQEGLEQEQGMSTDGGELLTRVDELQQQQKQKERRLLYQNILTGAAVLVGMFLLAGVSNLLTLGAGGLIGVLLIAMSLSSLLGSGRSL